MPVPGLAGFAILRDCCDMMLKNGTCGLLNRVVRGHSFNTMIACTRIHNLLATARALGLSVFMAVQRQQPYCPVLPDNGGCC